MAVEPVQEKQAVEAVVMTMAPLAMDKTCKRFLEKCCELKHMGWPHTRFQRATLSSETMKHWMKFGPMVFAILGVGVLTD